MSRFTQVDEEIEAVQKLPEMNQEADIDILYENSIYGSRLDHFRPEKEILAVNVVKWIDDNYISKNKLKICLLIDSGTTTYHVFKEIVRLLNSDEKKKSIWKERVFIITNHLPGIQYLIINCKKDPNNQRNGTVIPCFLLPGKTLSGYAVIASDETIDWIRENNKSKSFRKSRMRETLEKEWKCKSSDYKIISVISTDYVVYHKGDKCYKKGFWPVARGKVHFDVKEAIINAGEEIILISPLMKFSFASIDLLNKVNNLVIPQNHPDGDQFPSKLMYEAIPIENNRCLWFTTSRNEKSTFSSFSNQLISKLQEIYPNNVNTCEYNLGKHFNLQLNDEIDLEIPHRKLKENYPNYNLWDEESVKSLEKNFILI